MGTSSKKAATKSSSRLATNVAENAKVSEKKFVAAIKHEVTTKLDKAGMDNLIREKAYAIWESQGRKHGHDVEIWHQAEKEIHAQLKKSS